MARTQIELLAGALEAAYRSDRWHALLNNLAPVTDSEWDIRPSDYSVDVFGSQPELSIGDLARHVAGAFVMYGNRAFGDGTMTWERIQAPGFDKTATLAWLDEGYRGLAAGLAALADDSSLDELKTAHWGEPTPVRRFIAIMTNHMLYHAGEINRQLSLIRGATGWQR
jgi:uncharacterized damage-inducible protein DinB